MEQNEIVKNQIKEDLNFKKLDGFGAKETDKNLKKLVDAQKKNGGVISVSSRKYADKMIKLGYIERSDLVSSDVMNDIENFNKVNYFIYRTPEQIKEHINFVIL